MRTCICIMMGWDLFEGHAGSHCELGTAWLICQSRNDSLECMCGGSYMRWLKRSLASFGQIPCSHLNEIDCVTLDPIQSTLLRSLILYMDRLLDTHNTSRVLGHTANQQNHAWDHKNQYTAIDVERNDVFDVTCWAQSVRHRLSGGFESAEDTSCTRSNFNIFWVCAQNPVQCKLSPVTCNKDYQVWHVTFSPSLWFPGGVSISIMITIWKYLHLWI